MTSPTTLNLKQCLFLSASSSKMIKLSLLLLSLIVLHSLTICQVMHPYDGRQGVWQLLHSSIGISAMHMQLLHNNKVIMFDRTDFGQSNLSLPNGRCRVDQNDTALAVDCTAHSILYDIATNTFRPLMVLTDTWCSSGAVLPNGTLVQTGGYNDGDLVVRTFTPCVDDDCDWIEFPNYLSERRWYATNQILPDGRMIIVGGRKEFNYEFFPSPSSPLHSLDFLSQTRDGFNENNLYPFLHLLPNGKLFIFANTRSILLDYNRNQIVRDYPKIPQGDPRNYPSSGSSVLLPLDENKDIIEAEVLVCGGARRGSFRRAMHGNFMRASSTCGRLKVTDASPKWIMETMPIPRVMGDMLLLPTGDIIIINGAQSGTAGWELGRKPATRPIIYRPSPHPSRRFSVMAASQRPRMYHSSTTLLPDGRVIVGGSNPNIHYNFTGVRFPTDLSLEAYSPPYLSSEYTPIRPQLLSLNETITYGECFGLRFNVQEYLSNNVLSIRIVSPPFNTHSFAMNQRMVVLKLNGVVEEIRGLYHLEGVGPSNPQIAPSGYYLLFVVHAGIPSSGAWVKIQ